MSLSFRRLSLLGVLVLLAAFAPAAQLALANSYVVSNLSDAGAGSLRDAITQANANSGNDTITFSVSGVIPLSTALPPLTDAAGVTIDASSSTAPKVPTVEIRGNGSVVGPGIEIKSSNNVIRGLAINGFRENAGRVAELTGVGIAVNGYPSSNLTNNLIEYNYVGTDLTGNTPGPGGGFNNFTAGIALEFGSQGTIVRNNLISGNFGHGIYLYSAPSGTTPGPIQSGNTIRDNRIGVNAAGTQALANGDHGILVGDNSNTTTIGPNNVISGNGGKQSGARYGVFISGLATGGGFISANVVKGNLIGTNATGTAKIPNTGAPTLGGGGVGVGKSQGTTIGGANAADANVISGNQEWGVVVVDDANQANVSTINVSIQNNKIGVAPDGTTPLGNSLGGVMLWKQSGGVTLGPGNIISGNGLDGVRILAVTVTSPPGPTRQTRNHTVTGNFIGTNAAGTLSIPNGRAGVLLEGATTGNSITNNSIFNNTTYGISLQADASTPPLSPSQNTIGTNQIKSNGAVGIALSGASTGNTIAGNTIASNSSTGIQLVGTSGTNTINGNNTITGHGGAGIEIQTTGNTVDGNTIASNQIGINITTSNAKNNTIKSNTLSQNTVHGVLVSGAGAVGNRVTQTVTNLNGGKGIALASGGNLGDQANRPALSGVAYNGSQLSGNLSNAASCGASCTIEVFGGTAALTDEGPTYLASFTATGNFSNVSLAACKPFMIFTITDSAGNTSEFTSPIAAPQCVPSAPAVTLSDATPSPSQSALAGQTKVFTHTVTNSGTAPGALTFSKSSSNGWTTTLDTTACPPNLNAGASCTITLSVVVPANAQAGQSNSTTITASLAGAPASAQKTDTTTVLATPALSLTPANQTKSTGPGQPVSFAHTLTNLGNGTDTFAIAITPPAGWSFSVQPAGNITLAQNATAQVTVTYTPTAGIASPPDYTGTVKASSTAAPNVSQTVTDTISIISAAVPQITSVVTPTSVDPGGSVRIDYTITNVGNLSGTFDLSFSGPGWPIGNAVPASVTLIPSASQVVSTTLNVPANAIAGSYTARLTAADRAAPATSVSKTDTIVVKPHAALTLDPDQSVTRAPNAVYTDTLTLTNGGNFTDTIKLTASSNHGWSARPLSPTVTLNPGASTPVKVETTIPPGQVAGLVDTTTVTATSSLPAASDTALITTTIATVPGVDLTPASKQLSVNAGNTATFNFTLTNSGSITQSFTITATTAPTGWSSTLTPLSTTALGPGATVPVTLTITAPVSATNGASASVTITAECVEDSCSDQAIATARVGPPIDTQIGEDCSQSALPGALITCRHTITNTGALADTFALTLTSKLGWSTTYAPAAVFLAPGTTKTFTVTLQVPTSAPAGAIEQLKIRALSTALPNVTHQVTDTITVLQFGGVSLTPSQVRPLAAGKTLTFIHTLQNIGNGLDSFNITTTQDLNWQITVTPTRTTTLAPGINYPVSVQVIVPADVAAKAINRIGVRATSVVSPTAFADVTDLIGVTNAPSVFVYLPMISN